MTWSQRAGWSLASFLLLIGLIYAAFVVDHDIFEPCLGILGVWLLWIAIRHLTRAMKNRGAALAWSILVIIVFSPISVTSCRVGRVLVRRGILGVKDDFPTWKFAALCLHEYSQTYEVPGELYKVIGQGLRYDNDENPSVREDGWQMMKGVRFRLVSMILAVVISVPLAIFKRLWRWAVSGDDEEPEEASRSGS